MFNPKFLGVLGSDFAVRGVEFWNGAVGYLSLLIASWKSKCSVSLKILLVIKTSSK